jgi:hypothetical protein
VRKEAPSLIIAKRAIHLINVANGYFWKTDAQLNHVANIRYAHEQELTDLPGVTGIGIGKDHIILYITDQSVQVPEKIEDVAIVKICKK